MIVKARSMAALPTIGQHCRSACTDSTASRDGRSFMDYHARATICLLQAMHTTTLCPGNPLASRAAAKRRDSAHRARLINAITDRSATPTRNAATPIAVWMRFR